MTDRATFDNDTFFKAIDKTRANRNITWRQVAQEAHVSQSTLTRLAQGKRPDVDSLAALLSWGNLDANQFVQGRSGDVEELETIAKISTYLRADRSLSPQAAKALETVIEATYEAVGGRRSS